MSYRNGLQLPEEGLDAEPPAASVTAAQLALRLSHPTCPTASAPSPPAEVTMNIHSSTVLRVRTSKEDMTQGRAADSQMARPGSPNGSAGRGGRTQFAVQIWRQNLV